ncbi:hypothetical protein OG801_26320 [Nocardioides sp. NBC_00163]
MEYTCTGTPNQRWVIAADGAALKVSAKHSGLSLAVGSQRWRATPN